MTPSHYLLGIASFLAGSIFGAFVMAFWGSKRIEQVEENLSNVFESIAGQTLRNNSDAFLSRAREHMESMLNQVRGDWKTHKVELQHLVDPVKENLFALGGHVRELEQKREGAYQGLTEQLRQLTRIHSELHATTITLTQALKSSSVRGRWGEIQLRRVVELAGMVKHISFVEQISVDGGRPDMIIYLPNAGILPIDSKSPLESFLEAMQSPDENIRKIKFEAHAKALRSRARELGQKKYWEQFSAAPDFVVMFVPNESCLSAAFEVDPELLEYAIGQRVLLTTPITLIALLKSVAYGWQQHQLTENARQIAEQGQELYKRMETFIGHFAELGKQLNRTVDGYNKTVGSLEHRLMPIARRFHEMNVTDAEPKLPDSIQTQAKPPIFIDEGFKHDH